MRSIDRRQPLPAISHVPLTCHSRELPPAGSFASKTYIASNRILSCRSLRGYRGGRRNLVVRWVFSLYLGLNVVSPAQAFSLILDHAELIEKVEASGPGLQSGVWSSESLVLFLLLRFQRHS